MNAEEAYQKTIDSRVIKNTEDVQALIKRLTLVVNSSIQQGYTNCYFYYLKNLDYSISPRETPDYFSTVRKHFEDLGYSFRIHRDYPGDRSSVSITIDWGKKPKPLKKRLGFLRRILSKE